MECFLGQHIDPYDNVCTKQTCKDKPKNSLVVIFSYTNVFTILQSMVLSEGLLDACIVPVKEWMHSQVDSGKHKDEECHQNSMN